MTFISTALVATVLAIATATPVLADATAPVTSPEIGSASQRNPNRSAASGTAQELAGKQALGIAETGPTITNIQRVAGADASVTLTIPAPASGTPPYTYQWYQGATPTFSANAATLQSGATNSTFTDTGLTPNRWYYYRVKVTSADLSSTISYSRPAQIGPPSVVISYYGDSIGVASVANNYLAPLDHLAIALRASGKNRRVIKLNHSVNGTQSGALFAGAPTPALIEAMRADRAAGAKYAICALGMNDAQFAVSKATFKANTLGLCEALLAAGMTPVLCYPTYREPGSHAPTNPGLIFTEDSTDFLLQYQEAINELVAGNAAIKLGDTLSYRMIAESGTELLYDRIHPNAEGAEIIGQNVAEALRELLGDIPSRKKTSTLPAAR